MNFDVILKLESKQIDGCEDAKTLLKVWETKKAEKSSVNYKISNRNCRDIKAHQDQQRV